MTRVAAAALVVVGLVLVVVGVALWSVPAAFIVGGACLAAFGCFAVDVGGDRR